MRATTDSIRSSSSSSSPSHIGAFASTLDFATAKRSLSHHCALVLDDDSQSFGCMFVSLSSAGCPATLARRWAQIEPAVRRVQPTMIIFSTQLPELVGVEIIRRVREIPALRSAVVIALAPRESKKERRKFLDLGCDGYLWKPADRYLFAMDLVARTPRLLHSAGDGGR
jgi:DNA-binding response OmpR family regulator